MAEVDDSGFTERLHCWRDIAVGKYPTLSESALLKLRDDAAIQYLNGDDTELGQLFSEYLVFKALKLS